MSRLHYAARRGLLPALEEGIRDGCSINEQISAGFTALHLAAEIGHLGCVRALIEAGAGVDVQAKNGQTPLHEAASNGHLEVVKELIEHGSEIDPTDCWGMTPALWAAYCNRREIAEYLLEYGADPLITGREGRTISQWLEVGGVVGRQPQPEKTPETLESELRFIRKLMSKAPSVEEYAAHNGRNIYIFSFGREDLPDPEADAWAKRCAEILHSPKLLAECEERFLTGDELEQARRARVRRKLRQERDQLRKNLV